MSQQKSALQQERGTYQPKLPRALKSGRATLQSGEVVTPAAHAETIAKLFPHSTGKPLLTLVEGDQPVTSAPMTVGVVLSGGPAPGGHNAIAGIFDALKAANPASRLVGFLNGPKGVFTGKYKELTAEIIAEYRNTGGFDMIGSGRDKIETEEQIAGCEKTLKELGARALVVIGGDDSNTNAAILAENFLARNVPIQVIGLPKTIDGDMRNQFIEASFGFDTAAKTYANLVANVCRDSASARKYYHFIKLMGRSASHVALEVALQVQPNYTIISEEVARRNLTLSQIVDDICDMICRRAEAGKNYGVIVVPEGLLQFVPEFQPFFADLNKLVHERKAEMDALPDKEKHKFVADALPGHSGELYRSLPETLQEVLLITDSHGNLTVSQLETEKFLIITVKARLEELAAAGKYKGKFSALPHFFGYEGRCAPPTNFDADYCYTLGYAAVQLIIGGATGYTVSARNLAAPAEHWVMGGVPVASMLTIETRKGKEVPVIEKALVDPDDAPFQAFAAARESWKVEDAYIFAGPVQYFGPAEVCDAPTKTLELESKAKRFG